MTCVGLIGGTGLDLWGGEGKPVRQATPWGAPSDALREFELHGHRMLFLARHAADHSIPPHRVNYRANLQALAEQGAEAVLAVNAVGGITQGFAPGTLAVADQLIDYTWGRAHTFSDGNGQGVEHAEFGQPYDERQRELLLSAASTAGLAVAPGGCVGVTQGPRLETEAEIRRLERDGCEMVGMTSMPEAALARELALPCASLCVVANWAAGKSPLPISMADIEATLAEAMLRVRALIQAYFENL